MTMKMISSRSLLVCSATVVYAIPAPAPAVAQVDPQVLAAKLIDGDRDQRSAAVEIVRTLSLAHITPELRSALIAALEAEGRLAAQRRASAVGYLRNPELVARLALVVAALDDVRAIPALAGALGTSPPAMLALAAFGEPAAVAVLRRVADEVDTSVLNDGLVTLRFMAEGVGAVPLTASTRDRIRSLATRHLAGGRSVTTLWRAMDLAMALGDPDLVDLLQSIASDRDEVIARGVDTADDIVKTKQRALELLSGAPPLPRWQEPPTYRLASPSTGR